MICIFMCGGHSSKIEEDIRKHSEKSGKYSHLVGVPKALLPMDKDIPILTKWWRLVNENNGREIFSQVYIVTNAAKYKYYERWATANDFPRENLINNGSTSKENQNAGGAVGDLNLVLRSKHIKQDIMVIAGDMMFEDGAFTLKSVTNYFQEKKGEVAVYYDLSKNEISNTRGIMEIESLSGKVTKFYEKPANNITSSRFGSVVFYCFRHQVFPLLNNWLKSKKGGPCTFGYFMESLVDTTDVYGMKLPTKFSLVGNVSLEEYEVCLKYFEEKTFSRVAKSITKRCYARAGLLGNPSDGFNGKTISMSISNFWAEATIQSSEKLILVPHPLNDPTSFGSLSDLHTISSREGFQGGLRLMQATCKRFVDYCSKRGIAYHNRNFRLLYDTNIPRQVGLSGSSAIVTATFHCLMDFFGITEIDIPLVEQPSFVLSVETELGITAGLQDRVIQTYGGVVYMDFDKELMDKQGYGLYMRLSLDTEHFPKLWLAYLAEPSDSGKMHNDIKQRWLQGDKEVIEQMKMFGDITDQGKEAIFKNDHEKLGKLMYDNFLLRKKIYSEEVLGHKNIMMINIARKFNAPVKFPGSGGAVIGMCQEDDEALDQMKLEFEENGCVFVFMEPNITTS